MMSITRRNSTCIGSATRLFVMQSATSSGNTTQVRKLRKANLQVITIVEYTSWCIAHQRARSASLAAQDPHLKPLMLTELIAQLVRVVADAVHLDYTVSGLDCQRGVLLVPLLDEAPARLLGDRQIAAVI
jgi:hypothetical protein